jgi:H+/gluconate symporter-like permease
VIYEIMGALHAKWLARADGEAGQGTVEYVGLILVVGFIVGAVIKASGGLSDVGIAKTVAEKLNAAVESVGGK